MPSFRVETPQRAYDAIVERGSLARVADFLPPRAGMRLRRHHRGRLETARRKPSNKALADRGTRVLFFPGGEPNKRLRKWKLWPSR